MCATHVLNESVNKHGTWPGHIAVCVPVCMTILAAHQAKVLIS